ncbi:MAG: hypothetical protein KGL38_13810, partial [Gemmatimonadota bacterium]|nr:hypothetical protein [Gemmatimonadota bacterium]
MDHILAILAASLLTAGAPAPTHPIYESPALREFVARAAAANREPPPTLDGYRALVETEFGYVLHDTLGREQATQV